MIDRLQNGVPAGCVLLQPVFLFFRGKRIPEPVAITGSNDNLGMCIYGSSI